MTATVVLLSRLWACCVSWWRHLTADSQLGVLAVLDHPSITETQGAQVNPRIINASGLGSRIDWTAVTSDAGAWQDTLCLYGLAGGIIGIIKRRPDGREIADDILALGTVEYGIDIYLEPWPADETADMLAAWRDEITGQKGMRV